MTLDKTTPNFFILLGLNPDERWDPAKFEQVLREKRIEWSRQGSGVAKKALAAKKNLELLPEIRRVMEDPTLREAQAAAARAERASEQKAARERFEKELAYINAKEYIEQAELDAFIKAFKNIVLEHEILRLVKVRVGAPTLSTQQQAQQLEPSIYKDITDKLQTLHLSNLYELLGRPETTSNEELCRAAEQLYDDMVRRQPKTAEVTAKTDLAGHAKTIFKSREMRGRYNESIRQSSLNTLLKELDEIVSRTVEKEVYEGQILIFLKAAREAGWKDDVALARLKEYARSRKWVLHTLPTIDTSAQPQRCGYCQELNEKNRNFCRVCNEPLAIHCPQCGHSASSDEIWCGVCGFPVGNRYWVDDLLKRVAAVQDHDLKQAQELLQEAANLWKPGKSDERVRRIQARQAEIQQRVQTRQRSIEQLNQLVHQRQLYTARQYLVTSSEMVAQSESLQHTVDSGIAEAQERLKRAQLRTTSQEERIELCRQALRICADSQQARDLLRATPPTPPRNLQARFGGTLVSLTWEPSSTPLVNYRIVRKQYSQPISAKDSNGVLLGPVAGLTYDDTTAAVGIPLYYAVFTDCEGVVSLQGATLPTPVLLTQDIFDETVKVNDQQISISWKTPDHVQGMVVVRNAQAAPRSISDGTRLPVSSPTSLVDHDVQNGQTYYYRVYCQFKDHQGQLVTSPGKTISATPETPPSAITQMEITSARTSQGYRVQLRWTVPAKGNVVVLKSEERLPFNVSDVVPIAQVRAYGTLLQDRPDTVTDQWPHSGMGYYTAIIEFADMAYIGVTQRYACVDEVENLTAINVGTALHLQWRWPEQCQEVVVAYSYEGWPQLAGSPRETIHRVTRGEYDSRGHFTLRGDMGRDYYITVATVVNQGHEQLIGLGTRIQARLVSKMVLTYEIKQTGFLRKKRMLHLHARQPGFVPSLLVVSRRERLPVDKTEGEIFCRVDGPLPIEKELMIELPDKAFSAKTFGKLYLEDDEAYQVVNILHPGEEKLRLS